MEYGAFVVIAVDASTASATALDVALELYSPGVHQVCLVSVFAHVTDEIRQCVRRACAHAAAGVTVADDDSLFDESCRDTPGLERFQAEFCAGTSSEAVFMSNCVKVVTYRGFTCTMRVLIGKPGPCLERFVASNAGAVHALVVGAREKGDARPRHGMLGSVAGHLVDCVGVPVLVVKHALEPGEPRCWLMAVEMSHAGLASSLAACAQAFELVLPSDQAILLSVQSLDHTLGGGEIADDRRPLHRDLDSFLEQLPTGVRATALTTVRMGDAAEQIALECAERRASVLCLGHRRRSRLQRIFSLGSVARACLAVDVPVLFVLKDRE